jgi:uncharacterized protein (DUF433 family)
MSSRELQDQLWRSCYLGIRLGLESTGSQGAQKPLSDSLRLLGEVARGETTLHDAQYFVSDSSSDLARWFIALQNLGVAVDRDLATSIMAGLEATGEPEPQGSGSPVVHPDSPPLRVEDGGVIKVGRGRVSLDLVIGEYERGRTPEQIVEDYDALKLPDVYAAISYYLRHRDEVTAYMARRKAEGEALQAQIEAEHPRIGKAELLARRAAAENVHAPAGQ